MRLIRSCIVVLLTATVAQAQPVDAISRELSVFNDLVGEVLIGDAISRELSVLNDLIGPIALSDANSRELSVFNDLRPPIEYDDAVTREVSVFNFLNGYRLDSNADAHAVSVTGTLPQQLTRLNQPPPNFDGSWVAVTRADVNTSSQFVCSQVGDPLAQPFVDAEAYFNGVDEVTLDNCGSAFYRFTFNLPSNVEQVMLSGSANVDDEGVLWLNGTRLTAALTVPACSPGNNPTDSCYQLQDAQKDRLDTAGLRVLTTPTLDPFEALVPAPFRSGTNELIFAVAGDAGYFDPTGVEFAAVVTFVLIGDTDEDCDCDLTDLARLLASFGTPTGAARIDGDMDGDTDVDLTDLAKLLSNFGAICG